MDDIQRQRNEAALSTVNHAIAGEVADALGKISTVKETGEVAKTLAGQFLALSESDRETAGIATLSQSMRRAVNAAMRDGLKEEGKLGADLAERETLRNLNLTAAEKRSVESYSIGDVVVAHRDVKSAGLVSGERYVVTGADTATGTLALSGDSDSSKSASLKLDAKTKAVNAFAVYERESIALAAGDKVRIGTTDTERGFKTGDVATVIAADAQATTLRTKDGSDHELKREDLAGQTLTHAYASTVHDLQGATLDRLMFGMDARSPLATQKAFYVAVSRVRDDVTLVTDNKDGLRARLDEQTGAKESALDLISDTKDEDRRSREDLQVGRTERDHIEELMEELKAERTGRHQGLSPEEMSDRLKARNDALRAFTEGLKGETSMRDARETASEIIKDHQDASGDQDALKDLEEMIRNHGKDRGMEL
jgi:hypothetical protein